MSESPQEQLWLADVWAEHRSRIERLFQLRMPAVLKRRMGVDDLAQECYLACGRRMEFLLAEPEVPIYAKLRRIALQTLADMERYHLAAGKRDAMKESELLDDADASSGQQEAWARFADSMTSPRTHLEKLERQAMTRRVLAELGEKDREILELRHFEDLGNAECAAVLGIAPKAASIRYVRALQRFQGLVSEFSIF